MPTPRPFSAPTSFTPRFTPGGLLQRSIEQGTRDAAAAAARIRQNTPGGFFSNLLNTVRNAAPAGLRSVASSAAALPTAVARTPLATVMALSGARAVNTLTDPRTGLVPTLSNIGTGVVNLVQGRPYSQGQGRYGNVSVPSAGLRDFGPGYRESELRAGAAAEAFRPGAGFPGQQGGGGGGSPAAERAYQQEVSRTAQLAAQNPELQRYEKAREAAAASGDQAQMDKVRDLGMEMWAKANPTLARKVKPGQSGYDAIQRTLGTGQMGSLLNMNFDTSNPLATGPATPTASYEGATGIQPPAGASALPSNAFAGASAEPYAGFMRGQTLTSAPLGYPEATPTASYEGATGIQPLGTNIPGFDPKSAEAQKFLAMFKNPTFAR